MPRRFGHRNDGINQRFPKETPHPRWGRVKNQSLAPLDFEAHLVTTLDILLNGIS